MTEILKPKLSDMQLRTNFGKMALKRELEAAGLFGEET